LAHSDLLEQRSRIIDFEASRSVLVTSVAYADGATGALRPYCDAQGFGLAAKNDVFDKPPEAKLSKVQSASGYRAWLTF